MSQYQPKLTPGLERSRREGMTKEAIAQREHYALVGRALGERLVTLARTQIDDMVDDPNLDPYLEGLLWTNAGQVLASEGRRVAGVDFGKSDKDLEGRKR